MKVPSDLLKSVIVNREHNDTIIKYYGRFAGEVEGRLKETLYNKQQNISDCNKFWYFDVYEIARIKDLQKVNLCKDKFCSNCKKVKQASRMARFMPVIEMERQQRKYASQMVLTVPNVSGKELDKTIKRMNKAYTTLNDYFKGKKKIVGLPFDIGYYGAIKSLEVTYKRDSYHPHFHVLLSHDLHIGEKEFTNAYSLRHGKVTRKFSHIEIFIQKLWRMAYDGIRITKKNYDALEIGYSCMLDVCKPNDYLELFKYMVKVQSEDQWFMSYEQFVVLYGALLNVRQIQGYGTFFAIKDDEMILEAVEEKYNDFIAELLKKEVPYSAWQTPKELLEDDSDYTLISRKQIFSHLK